MASAALLPGHHVFAMYDMLEATSCQLKAPLCVAQHECDVGVKGHEFETHVMQTEYQAFCCRN